MLKWALVLACAATAYAAEPVAGKWLLKSQQVNGRDTTSPPLTLRITPTGEALEFEYSTAADQVRFTARLDGSPAEVSGSRGKKMGTARVTRRSPDEYRVTLEGPNRPTSNGKLTVSAGGKKLTSESDALAPGGQRLHTVQVFERQ